TTIRRVDRLCADSQSSRRQLFLRGHPCEIRHCFLSAQFRMSASRNEAVPLERQHALRTGAIERCQLVGGECAPEVVLENRTVDLTDRGHGHIDIRRYTREGRVVRVDTSTLDDATIHELRVRSGELTRSRERHAGLQVSVLVDLCCRQGRNVDANCCGMVDRSNERVRVNLTRWRDVPDSHRHLLSLLSACHTEALFQYYYGWLRVLVLRSIPAFGLRTNPVVHRTVATIVLTALLDKLNASRTTIVLRCLGSTQPLQLRKLLLRVLEGECRLPFTSRSEVRYFDLFLLTLCVLLLCLPHLERSILQRRDRDQCRISLFGQPRRLCKRLGNVHPLDCQQFLHCLLTLRQLVLQPLRIAELLVLREQISIFLGNYHHTVLRELL